MLILLDAIGARYGVDPESILDWSPFRLGLAMECIGAGKAASERLIGKINRSGEKVHPMYIVGL